MIEPSNEGFYIYTIKRETCELPKDYIYMPYGYNSWVDELVNKSNSIHFQNWLKTLIYLIISLAMVHLSKTLVL